MKPKKKKPTKTERVLAELDRMRGGVVKLPQFEDIALDAVIETRSIRRVEYLRIGKRTGSMLYSTEPMGLAVGIEPGAVLMHIFHVDPESAYRLGFERAPEPQ